MTTVRANHSAQPRRARRTTSIGIAVVILVLVLSLPVSVSMGAAGISAADVWGSVVARLTGAAPTLPPPLEAVIWELRLPRVLTAVAVGAGLGICGMVIQSVTRNPLADPYLLGLSSGASFAAVCVLILGVSVALPVAGFVGALFALAASWLLAGAGGTPSTSRTVLAGVAVSGFFSALTSLVIYWSSTGESYREVLSWLLGSLAGSSWNSVAIVTVAIVAVGIPLVLTGKVLDSFAFGDSLTASMGLSPARTRGGLLVACALLTGALVSVSGAIGFIGLIIPHAVRLLVGEDHRRSLPLCALAGAVFLLWSDTAARTLFAPREMPVGIVTALIGAPIFALILLRRKNIS